MPKGKPHVQFKWEKSHAQIVYDKGIGKDLQKLTAELLFKASIPYTPMSTTDYGFKGHMIDLHYIRAYDTYANLVYTASYAKYQYESKSYNHRNKHQAHPLATDHWVMTAWRLNRTLICKQVDEYRKKLAKNASKSNKKVTKKGK